MEFITDLPVELVEAILRQMPDIRTLLATLQTCRAIHSIYSDRESWLVNHVLLNEFGTFNLLVDAAAAWQMSKLAKMRTILPLAFCLLKYPHQVHLPREWQLRDALALSQYST